MDGAKKESTCAYLWQLCYRRRRSSGVL